MWNCRSTHGDKCCGLHDTSISSASLEENVLRLNFEDGIMLLPATWANPFKNRAYRSDAASVEIDIEDKWAQTPQDAVEVEIRGTAYLFGKAVGEYTKNISLDEWLLDIEAHPDKYEILEVYAAEGDWRMLLRGVVHDEWKSTLYHKADITFELLVYQKEGSKMRFLWNELNKDRPI